jgi:hypothetical protein
MHLKICEHEIECNSNFGLKCSKNKKCECIKEIGKEKYWDVLQGECIPASVYNQTCHNDSACQTLTQHTICNENNVCSCEAGVKALDDEYWNSILGKCLYPNGHKGYCLDDKWCRTTTEGTFCNLTNKKCECRKENGDENYWNNGKCHKAKEIGQLGCMNDEWCQTLTQGTFCDFNRIVVNKCECLKGFYWTGGYENGKFLNSSVRGERCGNFFFYF